MPCRLSLPRLFALAICGTLSGCVTAPALRPTAADLKPENIRTLIAKQLLQTGAFGSMSVFKAKIIDARISAPSEKRTFSGEPYTYYCVTGFIENPLYPIHQTAFGEVEVTDSKGQRNIRVRSRIHGSCSETSFEPFPEIEKLSVERYEKAQ
ncbi:hypothetical protein MHY87_08935 [Microvirga sp. ACRRW]|uniref:hypothetical protein n=1 Tax=Microvirga sp. ACRRW TaxID=2918205 RepID=UPI001EF42C18|nr:hypothetical protein [Microvirga sp. ACRRW]MCG7393027.1 hypothetical protein [Microvirga sp. ACRRW]